MNTTKSMFGQVLGLSWIDQIYQINFKDLAKIAFIDSGRVFLCWY